MEELELLAWAENSNMAEAAMLNLECVYAAAAACVSKEGEKVIKKLRTVLEKQVYGK